jgi:MTH538 TIR-like domain (DUF1863)
MAELCAFLSYRWEDRSARGEFEAGGLAGVPCRFVEMPPTGAAPDWRRRFQDLIADVAGVIVLVGPNSAASEPIRWEIGEASERAKRVVAVRIHNGPHRIPDGLSEWPVLDWDRGQIKKELETWYVAHVRAANQQLSVARRGQRRHR